MMPTNKIEKKELKWIQVLRGVAALLVVLLHATGNVRLSLDQSFLFGIFEFGGAGVDIFFVISGYIITYTSYKYLGERSYIPVFLQKRFVRIYPTYWIIAGGFILVQILLPQYYNSGYNLSGSNLLNTFLLTPGHQMVNGVSWTLTNELFFYLLFIGAFFVGNKRMLATFTILVMAVTLAAGILTDGANLENPWLSLLIFPMNLEFYMGVLAGLWLAHSPRINSKLMIAAGLLLLAGGAALILNGYDPFMNRFTRVLYFGVPSFLLLIGLVSGEKNGKLPNPPQVLQKLGDASYSLYLLHLPLLVAACKILGRFSIGNTLIVHLVIMAVIVLICIFSYYFFIWVEKPMIRLVRRKKAPIVSG